MKNLIISAEQKENYDKPLNVEIELLGEFTKTKEISNTRRLRMFKILKILDIFDT